MKLKKFKERDNKKIGVIVFTLVCLFLISGAILYRTFAIFEVRTNQNVIKGKVGDMGDIQFAFYIDDKIVKESPKVSEKEKYVFDEEKSNCTNEAKVYWDYQVWGPTVSNLTQTKTKCYLKFKTEYSEDILNGATPKLKEDLVPVTIDDDGTVHKADITQHWYNYESQQWANAVILENNVPVIAKDFSGNNNHGAIYGGTFTEEGLLLDGVDDYIKLDNLSLNNTSEITLEMTAKLDNIDSPQANILFELSEDFNFHNNSLFISTNGNYDGVHVKNNIDISIHQGVYNAQYTENDILDNNMNHYFFTINTKKADKKYFNAYINSTQYELNALKNGEVNHNDLTNMTFNDYPLYIGSRAGVKAFARMTIQNIKIYTREVNENEITNNSVLNDKLILYYNFMDDQGDIIPEAAIESYFVWIPRYKYQIWNGEEETKEFTSVQSLGEVNDVTTQDKLNQAKEIKIEFENKHMPVSNGNLKNQWLTHPAFTSFESDGFWVGKFETGYKGATSVTAAQHNEKSKDKVIIKPNVYSWRGIQVANAFETSKDYKTNLDSHMMKNMEWGAVAYLTNSQYGRCGDKCEEIRTNNSQSYVTGSSAKNAPTCSYNSVSQECNKYEESTPGIDNDATLNYKNKQSVNSSTTNNYTGIYDMSGGAWEYVFGFMKNESGSFDSASSGFTNFPEDKYYDSYSYSTSNQDYTKGYLGDGTKEFGPFYSFTYNTTPRQISGWNADDAFFLSQGNDWFIRGGDAPSGTDTGIAAFSYTDGKEHDFTTFRIILTP